MWLDCGTWLRLVRNGPISILCNVQCWLYRHSSRSVAMLYPPPSSVYSIDRSRFAITENAQSKAANSAATVVAVQNILQKLEVLQQEYKDVAIALLWGR